MKPTVFIPVLLLSFCFFNCRNKNYHSRKIPLLQWTVQESPVVAGFRGLSVVNNEVAWVSGSNGTVCLTVNGGTSWNCTRVPGADSLDFRDVTAFDASSALLLSAGQPARIYKTVNGGSDWSLVYENTTKGIFFDAFEFWDKSNGIAFSDPVDGHFIFITTADSGRTWQQVPAGNIPKARNGEVGFAASGSSLAVIGKGQVWLGTGGTAARVLYSADYGRHWTASETPMISEQSSTGIFSIAFCDESRGIAVGGDYLRPEARTKNAIYSTDGGSQWKVGNNPAPGGYRSCVTCIRGKDGALIAVGPTGVDYSLDYGQSWHEIDTTGFHAVDFAPSGTVGWAVGARGKIYRIDWPEE